jgi:glycosyltransferase involved in cell wall biosynthesis
LRIGIDGTCWSNERGYGRFAREIVAAMLHAAPEHQFVCFVDDASDRRFDISPPNLRRVRVALGTAASEAASAAGYRAPRDMAAMSVAVARESLDVFFSPSVYTYFVLPPRLRAVVTIHDAIAERFPSLTLPSARARLFWWLKMKAALLQSRRVLTVSNYAAADVERVHGVPRQKIDIAVEAPAESFRPRDKAAVEAEARLAGVPQGSAWFIYVGGFNPHKNLPSIIRAHAAVAEAKPANPPHLLLVGSIDGDVFHRETEEIRGAIDSAGTGSLVHWTGFLPDDQLSALHTGAVALLLPSAAEGFGLPAIEAAACGTPVIATIESPLPELLEGGGFFVAPGEDDALARAMTRLMDDRSLRDRMGSKASLEAGKLTWDSAARAALESLRRATE